MATPAKKKDVGDGELKGLRKAAAFMLSLDSQTAAMLLSGFNEREVTMLSEEMTRMGDLTGADMEKLLKEFNSQSGGDRMAVEPMLQDILERALGKEKAKEMLDRIKKQSRESEPFRSLLPLEAKQVATLLRGEHPQIMALVISKLDAAIGSELLRGMDENLRYDVIKRIAQTEETPSELIRQVDEMMEVRAYAISKRGMEPPTNLRFKTVAQMLNISEPSVAKSILEKLTKDSPTLASEIQSLMFVFDDLNKVDKKGMQKILGEVDKNDLALSLRTAAPEVSAYILDNMSARARDNLKEEMEMMGAKPLSEIEAAQKRILQLVRSMEEKGDLQVNRGNTETAV